MPPRLSACQRAAPDPRGVDRDETLLTVSATGRADTRPDEARLQLGVQSQAASSGEASRLNREKMERVAAALAKLGVKPDDLQTRNLSLQRIDYGPERGRFRADNMVEVKLRAMDRVGDAVTAVTEAGANVLSGPELRVSDRESASRSAYAAAYRAARARAEAYAGRGGPQDRPRARHLRRRRKQCPAALWPDRHDGRRRPVGRAAAAAAVAAGAVQRRHQHHRSRASASTSRWRPNDQAKGRRSALSA